MHYIQINDNGIEQIRQFLADNHQIGDAFTDRELAAWAQDAERNYSDGNAASIEIRASDCVRGVTVAMTVTPDGYDVIEVPDDDDE